MRIWWRVEDVNPFTRKYRKRRLAVSVRTGTVTLKKVTGFYLYRVFNSLRTVPEYLTLNVDNAFRMHSVEISNVISELAGFFVCLFVCVCGFLFFGFVWTAIENNYDSEDPICPSCHMSLEHDVHFVLYCPVTADDRDECISLKYKRQPCQFRLTVLLSRTNEEAVKLFALFLYKGVQLRSTLTT